MRILIVSRYKEKYPSRQAPFVSEQGAAIAALSADALESSALDVKHLDPADLEQRTRLRLEPEALEAERLEKIEVDYFLVKGNYVKQYFALRKKIKEWKPDIIHAHYGLTACVAELQRMVPVVTTFHNGETHTKHVNFVSSLCSKLAKHVIYVAPHIRQKLYFKAKNYSIIPCGITLADCFLMDKAAARKELGWDAKKKYILFGGAFFDLRKNYPLLRDAVQRLESATLDPADLDSSNLALKENNIENSEENIKENIITKKEESELTCISSNNLDLKSAHEQAPGQPSAQSCSVSQTDSSEKSELFHNSEKNQKNDWVKIDGGEELSGIACMEMWKRTRRECMLMMNAADVFALPTKNEGSPQALKEAMACNCPIVATDVADIKYMLGELPGHWILENRKGTPVDWVGDEHSAEELADLLKKALVFEGRTHGRERIQEIGYTNEAIARKIVKIYREILNV